MSWCIPQYQSPQAQFLSNKPDSVNELLGVSIHGNQWQLRPRLIKLQIKEIG